MRIELQRPFVSLTMLRGILITLLSIMAIGIFVRWQLPQLRQSQQVVSSSGQNADIATRSIVYRITRDRPTMFRFSKPLKLVRIVSQPSVKPDSARPGQEWTYSIIADLIDTKGRIIASHTVYSRSALINGAGNHIGPKRFFRDSEDQVALSDEILLAAAKPVAAVLLRTGPGDQNVKGIDLRVYERHPLMASVAESAFVRLSTEDQISLARANAFPAELLTQEERINIAVNQWRPVGPQGIAGRDYRMHVLYENLESNDGKKEEPRK
jgi:hypothetical protein